MEHVDKASHLVTDKVLLARLKRDGIYDVKIYDVGLFTFDVTAQSIQPNPRGAKIFLVSNRFL